jgi:hypothetical protein
MSFFINQGPVSEPLVRAHYADHERGSEESSTGLPQQNAGFPQQNTGFLPHNIITDVERSRQQSPATNQNPAPYSQVFLHNNSNIKLGTSTMLVTFLYKITFCLGPTLLYVPYLLSPVTRPVRFSAGKK